MNCNVQQLNVLVLAKQYNMVKMRVIRTKSGLVDVV